MSRIIKTDFGFHIDLDKIVTISDPVENFDSFGWFYCFVIRCQLSDKPIIAYCYLSKGGAYFMSELKGENLQKVNDFKEKHANLIKLWKGPEPVDIGPY